MLKHLTLQMNEAAELCWRPNGERIGTGAARAIRERLRAHIGLAHPE
jgi:hypothetical protein